MHQAELISFRAQAGTYGGLYDRASGMPEQTRALLSGAMERNGIPMLASTGLRALIDERMAFYETEIKGDTYAAYVNVGGGSASIGGSEGNERFAAGVHMRAPGEGPLPNCIATRMLAKNVPVINVVDAKFIADHYAMPIAPVDHPSIGQGDVFATIVAPGIILHPLRSWRAWRKPSDDSQSTSSMPEHVELMV